MLESMRLHITESHQAPEQSLTFWGDKDGLFREDEMGVQMRVLGWGSQMLGASYCQALVLVLGCLFHYLKC